MSGRPAHRSCFAQPMLQTLDKARSGAEVWGRALSAGRRISVQKRLFPQGCGESGLRAWGAPALPPVVEHVGAGAAEAGGVVAVHRDALELGAEAEGLHRPVGFFAGEVDAGEDALCPDRVRQRGAGVEERGEAGFGASAAFDRAEFDVAHAAAGLAGRTVMADGEPVEAAAVVEKHGVA